MGKEDRKGKRKRRNENTKRGRVPELGYYYIVTDTDQTEKNYLEGLKNSIPEKIKDKIAIKVAKSRTVNLVNSCKEGASLFPQFSEPWIVFDRDQVKDFDKIIEEAVRNDIHVGWSNPCFEIWLYAYFGSMPSMLDSVNCCAKFAIEYEKRTGQKYEKSDKNIYKKLCERGDEEKAIKIAQQKRNQCVENGERKPSKMIPCTTVDVLINSIKSKIKDD